MKRLTALLGAALVLGLAVSSTAAADTFRVAGQHGTAGGATTTFDSSSSVIPFTQSPGSAGPMSFAALRSIWQAAGSAYGIPWEVLAAINKVETNFGQNLGPSSAGAVGWMQFMPSTWARWGMDANGDGIADPNNPTDAIFSAARYLAGCGGQFDIKRAVYCYNHSASYVNDVLGLAAVYAQGGGDSFSSAATLFSSGSALKPQMTTVRNQIASWKTQVASARAEALRLGRAERRSLRAAATARGLSGQLEAHKRAVLLGARRHNVEARLAKLRTRLSSSTAQLSQLQEEATAGQLLSGPMYGGFAPAGQYGGVVSIALQYLGIPYKWAGGSPDTGFDCSGLVQYVFGQLGVSLPHNTVAQWNSPNAVSVPRNQLQPGDLVFFNRLDHVGIYIGNGDFVDAPHTGAFVRIDSLSDGWYAANYDGAKRVVGASLDSFQPSSTGTAFSSDVVYFTH
ncbi:MAG TPA: NlpC/P60 family protein [Gaiellaceae bacterium]|nr:NlpC/P60 family protein [Gaiellaceae bacterium]